MEEEFLLDEAARLYALSQQDGCRRRRFYRQMAVQCCLIATELRAARQFPGAQSRHQKD
jgi:hypothetical protein